MRLTSPIWDLPIEKLLFQSHVSSNISSIRLLTKYSSLEALRKSLFGIVHQRHRACEQITNADDFCAQCYQFKLLDIHFALDCQLNHESQRLEGDS